MIKNLRVTVDGKKYEVSVEVLEDSNAPAPLPSAPATPPLTPGSVSLSAPSADHSGSGAAPGEIPSPLSGRITAIDVRVGQAVKEGDHLITLEAMKMNTFIYAPRVGTVKAINVTVGATVEEGQGLILLA
ncbi:MAG: biotin/lipoyl-containing protein [Limisphaerales bacterium]